MKLLQEVERKRWKQLIATKRRNSNFHPQVIIRIPEVQRNHPTALEINIPPTRDG